MKLSVRKLSHMEKKKTFKWSDFEITIKIHGWYCRDEQYECKIVQNKIKFIQFLARSNYEECKNPIEKLSTSSCMDML